MDVGGKVWPINHGNQETALLSSAATDLGITWAKEAEEANRASQATEGFQAVPSGGKERSKQDTSNC